MRPAKVEIWYMPNPRLLLLPPPAPGLWSCGVPRWQLMMAPLLVT
jgi:hypothetical protein